MTTFHMETEIVRVLVTQFKQATDTMRSQIQSLNNSAQSIDWTGPSRDEFVSEAQGLIRAIEAQAEAGVMLAGRVEREVDEWEQVTASLSGSGGSGMLVSGGSASTWSQVPSSSLAPFFTLITVAPWLDGLPNWMRDLYRKFFPAPTPVPFPEVVSPVPEEVVPNNTKGSFGDLIDRPAAPATPSGEIQTLPQPAQPDSSSIPSRVGYDVYYEIPPKAQGAVYGGAACLPTSFSMLTDYFHGQNPDNKAVAPDDLVKMLDTGDGTQGKGVTFDKLNDDLSELGYKDTRFFQSDLGGLKDELKSGPVVVNVKVNLTSTPERALSEGNTYNHAVLVKGISEKNVLINDPWSGKEMEIPAEKFDRMWGNGDHWVEIVRPQLGE